MSFLACCSQPFSAPMYHFQLSLTYIRSGLIQCCFEHNMHFFVAHTILDISRYFPNPAPTRYSITCSEKLFSLITEPSYLNVSTWFSQYFFLSELYASHITCRVLDMTYVFFSLLWYFQYNVSWYFTCLLCNSLLYLPISPSYLHTVALIWKIMFIIEHGSHIKSTSCLICTDYKTALLV